MPRPSKHTRSYVAVVLVAAIVSFALVVTRAINLSRRVANTDVQAAHRPLEVSSEGYVSSKRCQACHPAEYTSWFGSYHRTMTQIATPETVLASFDGEEVPDVQGRPMRLERRGDEFWAEFDDPDWNGFTPTPARIVRQVVMMTGSHHQQVYWYRTNRGRLLGQLPGTFLIEENRWIPRRMVFLRPPVAWPPSSTGQWNGLCINCHATHGKPQLNMAGPAAGADTQVAELGIACEACHGPGEHHARSNQNPARRYSLHLAGGSDPTTVHPPSLDPGRGSQVCGQCHGVWMLANPTDEQRANVEGLSYRPGGDVFSERILARPSKQPVPAQVQSLLARDPDLLQSLFWSDGMIRVSGREFNGLVDSPCFANATDSSRTLSCFSCHTMHKAGSDSRTLQTWAATHQVSAGKETNEACLQCHDKFSTDLPAHTKHQQNSSGSSCYNCHMPYTSYGLLKALRSHQISSPTVTESIVTGRPNACNNCHLDRPLGWTARYLAQWYGTQTAPLSIDDETVAASILWAVKGDAGQRALMAWMMGWRPAQEASGSKWIAPYLSGLLNDPYDAVRFIAYRSMRSLPGFESFNGDFLAAPPAREGEAAAVMRQWRQAQARHPSTANDALLLNADGSVKADVVGRLLRERNDRPVSLNE